MPRASRPTEEHGDMAVRQSRIPAAGTRRPDTSAPRSVFEQAAPAERAAIVVRKGVPLPPLQSRRIGESLVALQQMDVGDCVELPHKQARGFYSHAKKFGAAATPPRKFVFRTLSDQRAGVWRTT